MMKKVLIAEDDRKIAIAVAARLRAHQFDVRIAQDGYGAVNMAVREQPDMIIMDINMPAGNGITAAERISNIGSLAGVPIVFITASRDPEILAAARRTGALGVLEKPFDSQELVDIIKDSLAIA